MLGPLNVPVPKKAISLNRLDLPCLVLFPCVTEVQHLGLDPAYKLVQPHTSLTHSKGRRLSHVGLVNSPEGAMLTVDE